MEENNRYNVRDAETDEFVPQQDLSEQEIALIDEEERRLIERDSSYTPIRPRGGRKFGVDPDEDPSVCYVESVGYRPVDKVIRRGIW